MTEGGELSIGVRKLAASAEPEILEISVADSGGGMDETTREHLFEPFFTTKGHGNGLGLAITQEIVEAHGGKIRCERQEPRGTRFVIELPTRPPAIGADPSR
jgi:signal transduction histidine kinase